jgi:hypothetical protein
MVFCSSCDGVPLKYKKRRGLQFTSTDYLSIVSTPLRIRWTIPLSFVFVFKFLCELPKCVLFNLHPHVLIFAYMPDVIINVVQYKYY